MPNTPSPSPDFLLGRDLLSHTGAMRRLHRHRSCQNSGADPMERRNLRILVCLVLVCCGFATIIFRLGAVMAPWDNDSAKLPHPIRAIADAAEKPVITDRHGEILAMDLPAYSPYARPQEMRNPRRAARLLASAIEDASPVELAAAFQNAADNDEPFVWVARYISPREARAVMKRGVVGVEMMATKRRSHPLGSLASHVTGFTDIDGRGLAGMERLASARAEEGRGSGEEIAPVALSLDLRVQHALEEELHATMTKFQGKGAAGVVMDANSGEILAIASLPNFHPDRREMLNEENRFNRATLGVYEFGSVLKPLTYATVMEATPRGEWSALFASRYSTSPMRIPGYTITDYRPKHANVKFAEGMIHSSNVTTAKVMRRIGAPSLRDGFHRLGMAEIAPLELGERGLPQMPAKWGPTESVTASYGHGIAVSPVHIVRAFAAVVNGGVLPSPTLLKGGAAPGARVLSAETSAVMRRLLRLVVLEGTGRKADADGYLVGGKTGTANQVSPSGGYDDNLRIASFVAAFPMDAPRYVTFMMVENPVPSEDSFGFATGGWVAASATRLLVARIAPLLGVLPRDSEEFDTGALNFLNTPDVNATPFVVINTNNTSAREIGTLSVVHNTIDSNVIDNEATDYKPGALSVVNSVVHNETTGNKTDTLHGRPSPSLSLNNFNFLRAAPAGISGRGSLEPTARPTESPLPLMPKAVQEDATNANASPVDESIDAIDAIIADTLSVQPVDETVIPAADETPADITSLIQLVLSGT
ncbi:MAG: penicillin-binding protein 2 [Alphaproteobacteria bacterium]|nr:penicillin-binding protein 2 [Alphaproteobacteria bacterium]